MHFELSDSDHHIARAPRQVLLIVSVHTNLLMLLTRHTQLLTSRANSYSSLHSTDETAISLVPELTAVFGLLQGLCLLNSACKSTCAEEWTMEVGLSD